MSDERPLRDHDMMIPPLRELMGPSEVVRRVVAEVSDVARSDFTVVIYGETGTGKELVARAIHHSSLRASGPFVPVDCGAIPETLLESELFGHEKGSFTGADAQKLGKFETARGGTLLLDEIANMPLTSQAKLLRVLQDNVLYRVGGTKPIKIDVRLLVASNKNLEAAVAEGGFREDLLYRLNEFTIFVPPLRERTKDILYLADRFLDITNMELKKSVPGFSPEVRQKLLSHAWPGNVRQLRSTVRRAVLLANGVIAEKHLKLSDVGPERMGDNGLSGFTEPVEAPEEDGSLKAVVHKAVEAAERKAIVRALRKTGGNMSKAAKLLKVDYKTVYTKIKKYRLSTKPEDLYGKSAH